MARIGGTLAFWVLILIVPVAVVEVMSGNAIDASTGLIIGIPLLLGFGVALLRTLPGGVSGVGYEISRRGISRSAAGVTTTHEWSAIAHVAERSDGFHVTPRQGEPFRLARDLDPGVQDRIRSALSRYGGTRVQLQRW